MRQVVGWLKRSGANKLIVGSVISFLEPTYSIWGIKGVRMIGNGFRLKTCRNDELWAKKIRLSPDFLEIASLHSQ